MSHPAVVPKKKKPVNRRKTPEQLRQQRLDGMTSKQSGDQIAVTIKWLSKDLWRRVRLSAVRQDRTIPDVVTEALERYLDPKPKTD